jgi:hypothetical protein
LPHRCVERVVLVRIVRMSALFTRELDGARSFEARCGRDVGATEIDRTVPLVGRPVGDQFLSERDDLVDVVAATGLEAGSSHAQSGHVVLEPIGLLCRQRPPRRPVTRGLDEEMVVDVSHVPAHVDR